MSVTVGKSDQDYLESLQVLRFVAAFLVLFGHVQHEVMAGGAAGTTGFGGWNFVDWGLGVDIFFVISGFIMFFVTGSEFGAPNAAARFLKRRITRIVPLYWVFTSLMLIAMWILASRVNHNVVDLPHILASYLFVPWLRPDGVMAPVLALGWTLNYEMFFYLVFALALLLPRRIGPPTIFVMMIALVAYVASGRATSPIVEFLGQPIILEFLFGIGIAMLHRRGLRIGVTGGIALVALGAGLAIAMKSVSAIQFLTRAGSGGLPAFLIVAGFTLGLAQVRFGRVLAIGGDASYALYLSHPFSINLVQIATEKLGIDSPALQMVLMIVAALGASVVVFRTVEQPMLGFIRRRSRSPGNRFRTKQNEGHA